MLKVINEGQVYGAKLINETPYVKGDLIYRIEGYQIATQPTYQTIQIKRYKHIIDFGCLAYLNHSCQPNVIVDTTHLGCYATRDIAIGEELAYFYPSTEWDMAQPFVCLCDAPECIRLVVGAKYLPLDVLSRYFINEHIREMAVSCLASIVRQ